MFNIKKSSYDGKGVSTMKSKEKLEKMNPDGLVAGSIGKIKLKSYSLQ
jgi:hypothetical protein